MSKNVVVILIVLAVLLSALFIGAWTPTVVELFDIAAEATPQAR